MITLVKDMELAEEEEEGEEEEDDAEEDDEIRSVSAVMCCNLCDPSLQMIIILLHLSIPS